MEVTTQVPQTGTRLRIDADRQFESQAGDSVLRVQGQTQDGSQVFDAAYVELDPQEADMLARLARNTISPQPQLQDRIAQEVQATFSARISGRDAQQIAHIATQAALRQVAHWVGVDQPEQAAKAIERVAERLERTAAKRANAPSFGGSGNGEQEGQQQYGQQQGQSQQRRS